jgi:hypothetical protein
VHSDVSEVVVGGGGSVDAVVLDDGVGADVVDGAAEVLVDVAAAVVVVEASSSDPQAATVRPRSARLATQRAFTDAASRR